MTPLRQTRANATERIPLASGMPEFIIANVASLLAECDRSGSGDSAGVAGGRCARLIGRVADCMRQPAVADGASFDMDMTVPADPLDLLDEYMQVRRAVAALWLAGRNPGDQGTELLDFNNALDLLFAHDLRACLKRAQQNQDTFIAMLGHDLRTPLHAIMMSAVLLQRPHPSAPSHVEIANRITSSGHRMDRLVQQLLEYARIRRVSAIPLTLSSCRLGEIVQQVITELRVLHPNQPITVSEEGDASGCWDRERLAQLVSNLAVNAIEHGGPEASVGIAITGTAHEVRMSVTNSGHTISSAMQRIVTQPAASAEAACEWVGGAGLRLGLTIVRAIVAAHHGTVGAVGEQGRTIVEVTLPRNLAGS